MNKTTTIRPFKNSDRKRLIEIFALNTPAYFNPIEQKDFEEYLDQHGDTYFVVEQDNTIVGCGGYHFTNNQTVGRLSWDLFHPESKGKGLGLQLISHCMNKLRNEPTITRLAVWTSQLAFQFYGKFGFITKEIRKDYWGPGLDLYKMEIELPKEHPSHN